MALVFAFLGILRQLMVFMASIWITALLGVLVCFALKPKWANLGSQSSPSSSSSSSKDCSSISTVQPNTISNLRSPLGRNTNLKEEEFVAIFKKGLVHPPVELNSPASANSSNKPKHAGEILKDFTSFHPTNAFTINFGEAALFAYVPPERPSSNHQRLLCGLDDIYCIFLGSLTNLCSLIKQYGLSKGVNEAMFVIEAYRTLRDRGPYPADQVLKDLAGSFGFVVYDAKAGNVFISRGGKEGNKLFWGIAADESVVVSDNLRTIKASCAQSFAQFPSECMFHNEQGLRSFEHPKRKMKAMPRTDSKGELCGADFTVDED